MWEYEVDVMNQFHDNVSFLYPLETENLFCDVFKGMDMEY